MAKRKRSQQRSFKYELLGIAMIILSVIVLLREGQFAVTVTKLFRLMIGELDWAVPLAFIYVGLYATVNRKWPKAWTARRTGIVVGVIVWMVFNHIAFIDSHDPDGQMISPGFIVTDTWLTLTGGFAEEEGDGFLRLPVGGGMLGAWLYAFLYFLFGKLGVKLILFAALAAAVMLVTGWTAADLGEKLKRAKAAVHALLLRLAKGGRGGKAKPQRRPAPKRLPLSAGDAAGVDADATDAAVAAAEPSPPAASSVPFPLPVGEAANGKAAKTAEAAADLKVVIAAKPERPAAQGAALFKPAGAPPAEEADAPVEAGVSGDPDEEHLPHIRDFLDHVDDQSEDAPPWAEAEPAGESDPGGESAADAGGEDGSGDEDGFAASDGLAAVAKPPASPYRLPSLQLLDKPTGGKSGEAQDFKANARKLEATLESFGVRAKVLEVVHGPAVTRYEIQPDIGVKVSRIVSLTDDIALALAAKDIRMEAPIPGKSAIGIEVPNPEVSVVSLREVMETPAFLEAQSRLSIALGRDISGQPIIGNLAKMPHLLVAGATGSGKSVCINGIITSILFKAKPDEVKFLMIDPKMVELNVYNGIPHLLAPVVTDPRRASLALKKVVQEMEKRYELFSKSGTRNIESYNALALSGSAEGPEEPLPYIVVIVDELADLMMVAASDVEDSITRLAQMARAAGIHLIIATQRPSVDVITGVIKANIPSRIAFGVSSQVDSRTILDMAGAEKLLGRGDMLYLPVGASKPLRVQGAFLSDKEVEAVVDFVRGQEKAEYREDLVPDVEEQQSAEDAFEDELYDQAVQIVVEARQASVSLLQRRMRIGYTRAARLIDTMEARGIVGPYEGSKPREVLLSPEQFQQIRAGS